MENTNMNTAINTTATESGKKAAFTPAPVTKLGRFVGDKNDLVSAELPGEKQRAEIKQMEKDIAEANICYGRVVGVEIKNDPQVLLVLKRDTLRIVIPAEDFFAHSNMKGIEQDNKETRFIRYRRKASHMFDGVVSFVPKAMGHDENGIPFVVASRKESMDKLQEQHFFGEQADVNLGSVAKASIISVGPRYITVECLGLEVVIGTGGLSATSYIEDASQEFHNGEGLIVAVEHLEVNKESRKVKAELSHALVERLEAKVEPVSDKLVGGRYMAKIVGVATNHYIAIITGLKIRGVIPIKGGYVGSDPLIVGDSVVMLVTGINQEKQLVIGRCMKST